MSNNAWVDWEGGEMAYSQALQAFACDINPSVEMNPILLKPQGNSISEVIHLGKSIGTTTAQKKLFFNLKKLKNQIAPRTDGDLKDEHVKKIAKDLDVSENEVVSMNRRLSGKEKSLNSPIGEDGDEWQDWIVDNQMDQELKFAHQEEMEQRKGLLKDSIRILNEREKEILYSRRLNDNPATLEELSKKFKISRERIRQIENKAFEKLQKHMLNSAKSKNLLPAN